jgi:paraquat-inducible protein B
MSDKPQAVAIGAFVSGALLIAVSVLIFVVGSGIGSDREKVVMVFDGSVKGLSVGAPVALRGVQIGQVTDIKLIFDTDTVDLIMVVEAELRGENIQWRGSARATDFTDDLIAQGLRAQLNTQSLLTGLLYVQLDFHPGSATRLGDIETDYTQIPTIPTELERITRQLESVDLGRMADNLTTVAEGLSAFAGSADFQQLPTTAKNTLDAMRAMSEGISTQLAATGPRLDKVLEQASTTVDIANSELPEIAAAAQRNLEVLDDAIIAFEQTMREIDALVSADSATTYQLNKALRELTLAGRSLQLLAKTLEEQPEALLRGKSEDQP